MAEPTCVMPSFSCTRQENENNTYGLGDSISFGRYLTEDLSWERWSSFHDNNNRKRYVEEAEKYSKPGSVAQKKAYFEAHFKKAAALRTASWEQEDGAHECGHEIVSYGQNRVNSSADESAWKENDEKGEVVVGEKHENGGSSVDVKHVKEEIDHAKENGLNLSTAEDENCDDIKRESSRTTQKAANPLQVSVNGIAESSCLNSDSAKRGDINHPDSVQPRRSNLASEFKPTDTGRNKPSSRIIPSCFCWSSRDRTRTARKKQEKAETKHKKFHLSFCFKARPSNR